MCLKLSKFNISTPFQECFVTFSLSEWIVSPDDCCFSTREYRLTCAYEEELCSGEFWESKRKCSRFKRAKQFMLSLLCAFQWQKFVSFSGLPRGGFSQMNKEKVCRWQKCWRNSTLSSHMTCVLHHVWSYSSKSKERRVWENGQKSVNVIVWRRQICWRKGSRFFRQND